jgi:hypothetical protein
MVVVFDELSFGSRNDHLKEFVAAAEQATGLTAVSDDRASDRGRTRVATLAYPGGSATPMVDTRVKIELHTIGGVSPHETVALRSILSEHWANLEGAPDAAEYDELAPFPVNVVAPCRTLVEKLVILHEAHTRDGGSNARRKSVTVRHYYDVWCLLDNGDILKELERVDVGVLAHDVATYSQAAGYPTAERPAGGFAASPAFSGTPSRAVSGAYDRAMGALLWPEAPRPTLDECLERVSEHSHRL